ncbi:sporulation protein [Marinomonas ushuaiensis DSM 15871]|uniref:Sporulation protein n=2 Tax=Marinomonas TaxID=28253 RepID=X7E627_9GAMM|nr:sporulation protein [Marinomonas ushuaiensis DSM 15871]
MKTSQKLVLVVAGLSLGACSSTDEKNTFMTYNDLQSKVISHDEQWETVQAKLDKIDVLEAEVAALKQDKMGGSGSDNMTMDTDVQASPMSDNETIMAVDESIPSEAISSENKVTAAPLLTENAASENDLVDSEMSEEPINAAAITQAPLADTKYEYGVQVASYANRDEAIRGWAVLNKKDPTSFKGLEPLMNSKEINGRTMYQLKVGPFLSKSFSSDFCKMLKEKGTDCYVSQYNGDAFTAN